MNRLKFAALAALLVAAMNVHAEWLANPEVFIANYYADEYDDVRKEYGYDESRLLRHWKQHGLKEGRRSSPVFAVRYYLQHNPDLAKSMGKNNFRDATEHWLKYGIKEGRPSHPQFHVRIYLQKNPDLVRAYGKDGYEKAVEHYLRDGYKEGRKAR